MPQYRVTTKRYWDGVLYKPDGKRSVITTDKPLKPVPKGMVPVQSGAEPGVEKPAKGKKSKAAQAEQDAQNQRDIDAAVSFMEGAPVTSAKVETL